MKVLTILGARPQFIKAAPVSREFQRSRKVREVILHTGQHYDEGMSAVFFRELSIPKPKYFLQINRLPHGAMIGRMMEKIEQILIREKPDWVLVYGDTNTTLAGSLAARKCNVRVAHVEAGLRSGNDQMPEETNRILTDRISQLLFCPTTLAVKNLRREGFEHFDCRIIHTGDVMLDALTLHRHSARKPAFEIPERFILATLHRAENTQDKQKIKNIAAAIDRIGRETPVILPLHPRTSRIFPKTRKYPGIILTKPLGYFEMLYLLEKTSLVMTDSGGLQKEAFFFRKPCVILRDQTEWQELVDKGYSRLAGSEPRRIWKAYRSMAGKTWKKNDMFYGHGKASKVIVRELLKCA